MIEKIRSVENKTSLAVDGDMLYIGTKQSGVLRFQRDGR